MAHTRRYHAQPIYPVCEATEYAKRGYPTRKAALGALNAARRHLETSARRVYKCPYCHNWHLTSMEGPK